MPKTTRLLVERLEDRCNPSTLGQAWPDAGHLTLSFAPDGAVLNGAPSNLFQTLNNAAPTAQWQQVVLKAFQTWAAHANLNIGLVADGGQPFGIDGAVQGDVRFGDIRVGMQALPANLVATTSPFSWTGSTWSGDMILNSSYNFGINGAGQYDLFTVALHEAGHAMGIPSNSADLGSIMYADYTGPRTGLNELDVDNIQTLYGTRTPDAFDAAHANNSRSTATALANSPTQLGFHADSTTAADRDYYKIVTPLTVGTGRVTVQVHTAGTSLLLPTLSVYNASGHLVATRSASSPFSNDVSVTLTGVWPLSTYYFEVTSAGSDAFGIGAYSAQVSYQYLLSSVIGIVPALIPGVVNTVNHLNTAIASATMLTAPFGQTPDQRFDYLYRANLVYGGDANFYQFQAPAAPSGTDAYALDAIVWQTAPDGLAPALHLYDAAGNPIAVQVLANSSSVYSIQILGVTAGEVFYVEVAGQTDTGASSSGGYVLGIKFNDRPETVAPPLGSNTLPTASSIDTGTLVMNQNGVFYFELAAANGSTSVSSNVTMTVVDVNGNTVLTLTAATGSAPRTAAVYLPAGTYTIVFGVTATAGNYVPGSYWISGQILSEPIGPYYSGSYPPPPPNSSGSTTPPGSSGPTTGATTTFASAGASVSVSAPSGTISVPIPQPGDSTTLTYATPAGTTTVTLTTASDGRTTLSLTTPSTNTIAHTLSSSGNTSTQTLSTSDGIQVTIATPSTSPAPTYSGPSSGARRPIRIDGA